MVADDQETTNFFIGSDRVNRCWLLINQNKVLVKLPNTVVNENVDVDVSVIVLILGVSVKRLAWLDSVLIEDAVSNVTKRMVNYNGRPDFIWII